jgi:hypothetical protein
MSRDNMSTPEPMPDGSGFVVTFTSKSGQESTYLFSVADGIAILRGADPRWLNGERIG